jgi:release factor glutamine methyltransferase
MVMGITIDELLKQSVKYLANHGVENSTVLDAQLILGHILKVDRLYLIVHKDEQLDAEAIEEYHNLLQLRAQGMPLQYITGIQEFMSLPFDITTDVLIPRGDTEILVEHIISKCKECRGNDKISIMDIGTGSGCIAVSLAYYIGNSRVYAVDVSEKALDIARKNAELNKVMGKVSFIQKDILTGFPKLPTEEGADIIVSNPPYIKTDIIDTLQVEVKKYEPHLALDGGLDGLVFYRTIIQQADEHLRPGGLLAFEVDHDQSDQVVQLIEKTKMYKDIEVIKDLSGINRVVAAIKA